MIEPDADFEILLLYLRDARGLDFTGYKRSTLVRRVSRRMGQVGVDSFAGYHDYLQVHPGEFTALLNTILIHVTSFFRDPEVWDHLRAEIVPELVTRPGPVRAWSAGCASGQEAYTIAIVLAEEMGIDAFRQRVKIYATDVAEDELVHARHATYSARDLAGLPPGIAGRYFEATGSRYTFRRDLRRSLIFGRNDLVRDAPIPRVDLLVCRNTLMYFNAEAQARILARFHHALADRGVLFLGRVEMMLRRGDLFDPVDLKSRIFRKIAPRTPEDAQPPVASRPALPGPDLPWTDRLHAEAFRAGPVAQVVVTADGLVALINRQAETLFGLSPHDIGQPFRDLSLSYRPVELRHHIQQAQVERRPQRITGVTYLRSGDLLHLEVLVSPLADLGAQVLGVALAFVDATAARRIQDDLEATHRALESAYEELQSTNEELETTNEELQSSVEELETTNEELQSTNEELETTNEELQSANDEMQAINDEMRLRTAELDRTQGFRESVLTGLQAAVVMLDPGLQVRGWSRHCEDLWGLRAADVVGQHFLDLDTGLPTDRVRPMIRHVLTADEPVDALHLAALDRSGRRIRIRVAGRPLRENGTITGAVLVLEPAGPVE